MAPLSCCLQMEKSRYFFITWCWPTFCSTSAVPTNWFQLQKKSLPQRNVRADKSIFLGECSEAECWTNDCVLLTETDAYVCSFCQGVWAFPILFVTAKLPLMRIKFSWKIISHELSGAVFLARFVNSLFPKTESLVKINSESLQF